MLVITKLSAVVSVFLDVQGHKRGPEQWSDMKKIVSQPKASNIGTKDMLNMFIVSLLSYTG